VSYGNIKVKKSKTNTYMQRLLDEETKKKVDEELKALVKKLMNELDVEQWPNVMTYCMEWFRALMMKCVITSKPAIEEKVSASVSMREASSSSPIPEQFAKNVTMQALRDVCGHLAEQYEQEMEEMGITPVESETSEASIPSVRQQRRGKGNPFVYMILMQLGFAGLDMLSDHFKADHPARKMIKKFRKYFKIGEDEDIDFNW